MKSKKNQKDTKDIIILLDYLALIPHDQNKRVQTFFNLLYVQEPPTHILLHNPLQTLKTTQETQLYDIYEASALLLACNSQNIHIFTTIPSFITLCQAFCSRFNMLSTQYYTSYIQCVQASILQYLDSKAVRAIIKHTKTLRKHGIISFHNQKCIETAVQIGITKTQDKQDATSITTTSFIHLSPEKTPLKNQFDAIAKAKKILKKVTWANKLMFLCEEDFTKKIIVLGRQKTGKSTLISTMLYDNKKSMEANMPLEAKAPIEYCYGKGSSIITYMQFNDLQSLQESPIKDSANAYKNLQETFQDCLEHGSEKIKYEKIYDTYFTNNKIFITDHIIVPQDYEPLQFMRFINTPSLIPQTFRHLQIYSYAEKSDIAIYLANFHDISTYSLYEKMIATLLQLINKKNILHIHFIVTNIDEANVTLKKRQSICQKIKSSIEQKLTQQKDKQKRLEKLNFHFITSAIAHSIRLHGKNTSDSGFDIATSGILELEAALFAHVFKEPSKHFYIQLLENILKLCRIQTKSSKQDYNTIDSKEVCNHINRIKSLCQEALKKLNAQSYSFYNAFANLRDNLYSQFIQSLSYEAKKRGNMDIQKLKTSMIQSIIVGLNELSLMLQNYFFDIQEIHKLTELLQPNNAESISKFSTTKTHKEILELIFTQYKNSIKADFFGNSNAIVAEHLAYRLDTLLPNTIQKKDIQEDSVIKPLKDSFDYYFLLLERNIDKLFQNKVKFFHLQLERLEYILESCFIEYYDDSKTYDIEDIDSLIAMLTNGDIA